MSNDRIYAVISALAEYVRSPSLRHLRDPHNLQKLAKELVTVFDRAGSVWTKWDSRRDDVAKAAVPCWIPIEDLLAFLNTLPGPPLTLTDVKQRLRALWEEPYSAYPNVDLSRIYAALIAHLGCLAFESQGAFASQRRMPAARVIEAVDVLKDAGFGLAAGFPRPAPDQLGLDGLEERLDNGVVITIALAAH